MARLGGEMTYRILQGDPEVSVLLRRSTRARRMSLRISQLDGRVTLTIPNRVSEREAMQFVEEKADWLRAHLARRPEEVLVQIGGEVLFRGRSVSVVAGTERGVQMGEDFVAVPGAPDRAGARLAGYFKQAARDRLAQASDQYAAALGRPYSRISLRDTRSRWGSCSSAGGLMYSWRLVMAPDDVLGYVAAHEVAHLAEMNHSSAFWDVVEQLYGDYAAPRQWLRDHGAQLHRYRFVV